MSDRKPKVGEVWTIGMARWECLKDIGGGRYVWLISEGDNDPHPHVDDALFLNPPTTPPPSWLDGDCWVAITDASRGEIKPWVLSADAHLGEARCKLDPSTFEWLDGR